MPRFTLLFATTNQGKLAELEKLLRGTRVELIGIDQAPLLSGVEIEETGATFEANARLKAEQYGRLSGYVTLADDSGLSVDTLGGEPGVFSKRFGATDPERIAKLLALLRNVPENQRTAHFTSALALYDPSSDKTRTVEGVVHGMITTTPRGSSGFGYDPVFYSPELGKTFGEATYTEKNQASHRARAFAQIIKLIKKFAR